MPLLDTEIQERAPMAVIEQSFGIEAIASQTKLIDPPKGEIAKQAKELVLGYGGTQQDFVEMAATIQGESGFRHEGIYGDQGKAYGIGQFHEPTFYGFAKEMGLEGAEYKALDDQLKVMAWAFTQGEEKKRHWTEWRKLNLL